MENFVPDNANIRNGGRGTQLASYAFDVLTVTKKSAICTISQSHFQYPKISARGKVRNAQTCARKAAVSATAAEPNECAFMLDRLACSCDECVSRPGALPGQSL